MSTNLIEKYVVDIDQNLLKAMCYKQMVKLLRYIIDLLWLLLSGSK